MCVVETRWSGLKLLTPHIYVLVAPFLFETSDIEILFVIFHTLYLF